MSAPGGTESSKKGSVRIATSSPVSVPYTPPTSSALETSMLLIFACAYGDRTKWRKPIPCRLTSSTKTPWPCTRRWSSLRGMLWPAQPRLVSCSSTVSGFSIVSITLRRPLDRFDDVHIPRAAADVSLDRLADLRLARARVRVEQVLGRHQHSGRAVAALEGVIVAERLLERVQRPVVGKALDRLDRGAVRLDGQHHAALDRFAVVEDRAGPAVAGVAADVRAGQLEVVAEEVDQ